ncbi:MAG: DNA methyltransferase [bacterium]
MAVLTTQQRNKLESIIIKARVMAENGARNALVSFAVNAESPFVHMSAEQKILRNRLRYKARLLGDELLTNGQQQIDRLAYELAYEYWHKMLFAKFLEANGLLIHPDGVPVTMAECEELAKEEGDGDKWNAAANYASKMLPAIFKVNDPLMKIEYAAEDRIKLESLLDGLETEIFVADDALGWVYQFWQSEAKAKINASGDKINGEKLPAVTQLFTEPYMVHFLIDNTLGAWWVSRNPGVTPPISFEYLRTFDDGKPAAGSFEGWPDKTAEITSLDPCMGSGHFLVSLFTVFVNLRMFEENINKEEATDKVILENLHGLEIDPRCTQIAAFNLALTAWKFCGHYKILPEMNLACSGVAPKGKKEDWVKLAGGIKDPVQKSRAENGMKVLYDHFQLAPELGSLLDPSTIKADVFTASFEELNPLLNKALLSEFGDEQTEIGVVAAGIAKAGQLLAKKYTLQITNVPYLSRGKQAEIVIQYCEKFYPKAKGDLATVFLEKMIKYNENNGISCCVIPQNWLFLTTYRQFREKLINKNSWSIVAKLGVKSFQTPMWDFNVMLISIQNQKPKTEHVFYGLDVSTYVSASEKDIAIKFVSGSYVHQLNQLKNPDSIVSIEILKTESLLGKFANALAGTDTGDGNRFKFMFWELLPVTKDWIYELNSFEETKEFAGREHILFWQGGKGELLKVPGASIRNVKYWNRKGIYVVRMAKTPATISFGEAWDRNGAMIVPEKEENLLAIWEYAKTNEFRENLRKLNQKLSVSEATFPRINFNLEHWQKVAAEKYPNGLPKPYSDDPTQWLFHGNPIKADNPLQVAIARSLGYKWPAESDENMELADEARALIQTIKQFDKLADEDGIVCLPSVNGEFSAADRLMALT